MHLVTLIDKNFQKLSEICLIEGLITEDIISDDIKRHRLGYFWSTMGEKEQIQEAETRLYTRDLVIQDCNSYIKQVIFWFIFYSEFFLSYNF